MKEARGIEVRGIEIKSKDGRYKQDLSKDEVYEIGFKAGIRIWFLIGFFIGGIVGIFILYLVSKGII